MTTDRFEATFVLRVDRATAWTRLTDHADAWLPGFDSTTTRIEVDEGARLHVTKDEEPCAGTDVVVTLTDVGTGTRITVVQSGFGDRLPAPYEIMAVGWRHIVADLETYLTTGAHAARHLRPWGDLGAVAIPDAGGMRISDVRAATLAARLGLEDDDLLVVLGGAPVSSHDELVTVLRVLDGRQGPVEAEWVRQGDLARSSA